MSPHVPSSQVGIVATKTLTLILGGLITYYSYQAYQRTSARELQALSWGFGIMTFGALIGGVIDIFVPAILSRIEWLPQSGFQDWLVVSVFVQSLLTTVAFAIILYSLYVD
jgi:TRAP-type C4-dicarboxylate transport system permease small subunit